MQVLGFEPMTRDSQPDGITIDSREPQTFLFFLQHFDTNLTFLFYLFTGCIGSKAI